MMGWPSGALPAWAHERAVRAVNKQTNREKGELPQGLFVLLDPETLFDPSASPISIAGAAGDPCVVIEKSCPGWGQFIGLTCPKLPAQTLPKRAKPGNFGCAARASLVTCFHHPAAQRVFRQGCGGSKPAALLKTTSVSGAPLILATRPPPVFPQPPHNRTVRAHPSFWSPSLRDFPLPFLQKSISLARIAELTAAA